MPIRQSTAPIRASTSSASTRSGLLHNSVVVSQLPDDINSSFTLPSGTVGHQFLFGLIPFTRLQFERGPSNALQEIFLEHLLDRYTTVLELSTSSLHLSSRTVDPTQLASPRSIDALESRFPESKRLRTRVESISINGYDAILFRIRRVKGSFAIEHLHESHGEKPISTYQPIPFEAREYGVYAHASELATLLRRSFLRALRATPFEEGNRQKSPRIPSCTDGPNLLIVQPPHTLEPPPENSSINPGTAPSHRHQDSRDSTERYESQLARAIQIGIRDTARDAGFHVVSVLGVPLTSAQSRSRLCPGGAVLMTKTQIVANRSVDRSRLSRIFRFVLIDHTGRTIADETSSPLLIVSDGSGTEDEFSAAKNHARKAFQSFFAVP